MNRETDKDGTGWAFYIVTLGCKVNQYESHALREAWLSLGYRQSVNPELADVILINSCAITAKAVADVRGWVRKMHKASPDAAIIVSGCAAEVMPGEFENLPGVCEVVGRAGKAGLLDGPPGSGLSAQVFPERILPGTGLARAEATQTASPTASYPDFTVTGYDRSRAVLKVQDGCSHGCAYCIVPRARGGSVSRTVDACVDELRTLLASGFGEVVISGINLRQYQSGDSDFWGLMSEIEERLAPEFVDSSRLRLSSLEPGQLDEKALEFFSRSRLTAPQLHISLQSGSPDVLARMRRGHYSPVGMSVFFERLRDIWPIFGLGADVIAGFPGETDAEHEASMSLFRELPLTYAHVFPFSSRPGTLAAKMPGQVENAVKKERARELRELVAGKKSAFLSQMTGLSEMMVVFEAKGDTTTVMEAPTPYDLIGVNEYYVNCRLKRDDWAGAKAPPDIFSRELIRVRPVDVHDSTLIVTDKF